jgi:hypothetical protein
LLLLQVGLASLLYLFFPFLLPTFHFLTPLYLPILFFLLFLNLLLITLPFHLILFLFNLQ